MIKAIVDTIAIPVMMYGMRMISPLVVEDDAYHRQQTVQTSKGTRSNAPSSLI